MNQNFLNIGVSGLYENYHDLISYCESILPKLHKDIQITICLQKSPFEGKSFFFNNRLKIIFSKSIGLSINRNIILSDCDSKFLWIQDDDLNLNLINLNSFVNEYSNSNADIIFTKIRSLETRMAYKDYSFHKKHSSLNSFKISSIEIIINTNFYKKNDLYFDISLGLGTPFCSCEENLFIWNCFSKSNKVLYLDVYLCNHTTQPENRKINELGRFKAKGYLLKKLPLLISIPLLFRWIMRGSNVPFFVRLVNIKKGFLHKKK